MEGRLLPSRSPDVSSRRRSCMDGGDAPSRAGPGQPKPAGGTTRDSGTQTDSKVQGHGPMLSEANLFTLLSLWMELFPQERPEDERLSQVHGMGLVVARDSRVLGLHCSGPELHAGQAAVISHGADLADCQLYFSRRPCATCLKMLINAGVCQISFWPGDPEVSLLRSNPTKSRTRGGPSEGVADEAALDATATEKLKSNCGTHIGVLLEPPAVGLAQFVDETSRGGDFMERLVDDEPGLDMEELFNRERSRHLKDFSRRFLVQAARQHRDILSGMGLENFCREPCFSNLRNNMRTLVEVLASVVAGLPQQHYGFYRDPRPTPEPSLAKALLAHRHEGVSQEAARHCVVQAILLSLRTEDPKVGVGAVIWAKRQHAGSDGTGRLYLVGCGYNAYPRGSLCAEFPQMDYKQLDRQWRKYRYIVHAEQNALTFRSRPIKPDEPTMLFVTKCPCDECVPLIKGAGVTHIYTTEQDRDKDKEDISYLMFSSLRNVNKFIWQRSPSPSSPSSPRHTNGCGWKHGRLSGQRHQDQDQDQEGDQQDHGEEEEEEKEEGPLSKRLCTAAHNSVS
ncbi:cytidine and dCMP deaminase domain-containing protein 1 [Nelusetta ayraudi]|uniref:cytidine and dCMP deaminase domain-containing protein 1 n=1 Tax=Nelusetta ayraudi TaxID=303726 RepID=UPI003F7168E3